MTYSVLILHYPDANTYGLNGTNHTTSIFNRNGSIETLLSPTLNITSFYTPSGFAALADSFNGFPNGNTDITDWIQDDLSQGLWVWDSAVYNLSYVLANGECLPLMTHNWGFSFLGMFILLFLTAVWSIGMYIMWLDAYFTSRFARQGRDMGPYKASWDMAAAMSRDISTTGFITEATSNSEVKNRVRKARNGNHISYQMTDIDIPISRFDELRIWWTGVDVRRRMPKREKHRPISLEPFAQERHSLVDPPLSSTSSAFYSPYRSPLSGYTAYSPGRVYDPPSG